MHFSATFFVFLWKHYKRLLFSWKKVFLSTLISSLLFFGILSFGKSQDPPAQSLQLFSALDQTEINGYFPTGIENKICYVPNKAEFEDLMEDVRMKLEEVVSDQIVAFNTEKEIQDYQVREDDSCRYIVIFSESLNTTTEKIRYTIRVKDNNLHTEQIYRSSISELGGNGKDNYIMSGYLALQIAIDRAITDRLSRNKGKTTIALEIEQFPLNPKTRGNEIGHSVFHLFFYLIYLTITLTLTLEPLVQEKEDGIKEFLKIATPHPFMNDAAFYIVNYIIGCVLTLIIFCQVLYFDMFSFTCLFNPIILTLLFIGSMISFTFFVSVFFEKVIYSANGGFLFYVVMPVFFSFYGDNKTFKLFKMFDPFSCFSEGFNILLRFRDTGRYFTFADWFYKGYPVTGGFNMFTVCLSFVFMIGFYMVLYVYLSNVFPGRYGTPKPFYFIFMPSYYSKNKVGCTPESDFPSENSDDSITPANIAIRIRNLKKVFKSNLFSKKQNVAVDIASLDLERNKITALLGHNGAGKTTIMSIIIGYIPSTSGTITLSDVDTDMYKSSMGYCPQHDVFIRYLNCVDHLKFFGQLRGLNSTEALSESKEILQKVNLTSKALQLADSLSSGMKRRLCLANAIIGNTKIIILDEPTSGLDPESRRDLWNVLLPLRKNHTILITTHFMEEADVLGDKIAIMENGSVVCHGTSMQLKKEYGNGYTLKILMNDNFLLAETLALIKKDIPRAEIKSTVNPTICITLPYESQSNFSLVLEKIENNRNQLGIDSLSMSNTTMEEVFLNSANFNEEAICENDETDSRYIRIDEQSNDVKKFDLPFRQFMAIGYKKMIYLKSNWFYVLLMCSIPIVLSVISFIIINGSEGPQEDLKSLDINTNKIANPEILFIIKNSVTEKYRLINTFTAISLQNQINPIFLNESSFEQNSTQNILLTYEVRDIIFYHERLIAAIEVDELNSKELTFKIYYSGNMLHSSTIAVNLINNSILKFEGYNHSFVVRNEPIRKKDAQKTFIDLGVFKNFLATGLFFYILFYISLPFAEQKSEFKILQNISPTLYWISCWTVDFLVHAFVCVFIILVCWLMDTNEFVSRQIYGFTYLLCLLYGFAYIPFLYLLSKFFKTLSSIYSFLFYKLMICSIASTVITLTPEVLIRYNYWTYYLYVMPDFAFRHAINVLFLKYQSNKVTTKVNNLQESIEIPERVQYTGDFFDPLDITKFIVYMLAVGVIFMIILIKCFENIYLYDKFVSFVQRIFTCKKRKSAEELLPESVNVDVEEEAKLVKAVIDDQNLEDFAMIVSKLEKSYQNFKAVKGIDFTIKKGECFGLLGMNGAGKSSTFKMMTLNETLTSGKICIKGFDSKLNDAQYKTQFGYCPEMHALNNFMTGYEMLKYFAWVKGTSPKMLDTTVKSWLKKMDLEKYGNVQIGNYSGGTKRKLSTAIAMISDPFVILLDEPTTGVDPMSRRFMWKCIKEFQENMKTIVLTSHSMDECEQLCNRLAIMVEGRFKCIGCIQKLKTVFGSGFSITIKTRENALEDDVEGMKLRMNELFSCQLRDDYAGTLIYNVLEKNISWGKVFDKMDDFATVNSTVIEDFQINEATLEDIFLQFRQNTMDLELSHL